jgi:putative Mg2+ transporter-C (MgtC) family protein
VAQGIGFLGAGLILHQSSRKEPNDIKVKGLTSAAAIWATSALGIAVGVGIYPLALLGALFVIFTLKLLLRFER